ncbi:branched-chain amino acid ABC transporter permease [Paenalcaligenes hominis]|uniref:branched-chain amino acid ABC transporter permease n=1 Tax=Paenalcaligenes hominis TaxID=643674 RepID=UPI0035234961
MMKPSTIKSLGLGVGLVGLGVVFALSVSSSMVLSLATQASIFAIFALGVGVLLRQNGMVSFGHAAFYGVAGYAVALLVGKGFSAEAALLISVLGMAVFAALLGLSIVRVPGIAFGMLTLAIGQMFFQLASTSRGLTGGADGMYVDWPATLFGFSVNSLLKQDNLFILCWTLLVILATLVSLIVASRFGHITAAIRDNEERARFIGIKTLLPRVAIFTLSATITSIAGLLSVFHTGFISPESLHWSVSGSALMMVIVGGYRNTWGPAIGAMVFFLTRDLVGDYAQHWLAIFGVALIVVIVFSPEGISGLVQRLRRSSRTIKSGV